PGRGDVVRRGRLGGHNPWRRWPRFLWRTCEFVMASEEHQDSDDVNGPVDMTDGDDVDGPFDIDDFDDPSTAEGGRLNLGSVLIPMPEAGQVQVELTEMGVPSAVWVVTPNGRFTVAAYAAPKTSG